MKGPKFAIKSIDWGDALVAKFSATQELQCSLPMAGTFHDSASGIVQTKRTDSKFDVALFQTQGPHG
ncbi:MAG: hypothetical protein EXS36_06940 [Pedosphaera sp.]|nr:hypothetical protein [Pedosphaera sp.]